MPLRRVNFLFLELQTLNKDLGGIFLEFLTQDLASLDENPAFTFARASHSILMQTPNFTKTRNLILSS